MDIEYYKLDPTGNITLIVKTPVPRDKQCELARKLMLLDPEAEQVGFIEKADSSNAVMRLQMMGGEFCGNATVSAASVFAQENAIEQGSVCLEISGIDEPMTVSVKRLAPSEYTGCVSMPLPEAAEYPVLGGYKLPVVRFQGISHIISDGVLDFDTAKSHIKMWCQKLGAEALGVMLIREDELTPLVYVAATDTVMRENSCASGSTAAAAYFALRDGKSREYCFSQPGGSLSVRAELENGKISALILTGRAKIAGTYATCVL